MGFFKNLAKNLHPAAGIVIGAEEQNKAEEQGFEEAEKLRREGREREERLIEASALTPDEQKREEETFALERRRGSELERRAGLGGEEILGETGAISREALARTREDVSDPSGGFESVLAAELEQARMFINQDANRRGVFGGAPAGGIRFEQMGRAGIELAIKSARERMASRNAAVDRAFQVTQAGLQEQGRARGESADFLANSQSLSQAGRNRAVQGNVAGAGFGERGGFAGSEITTDILGGRIQQGAELTKSSAEYIQEAPFRAASILTGQGDPGKKSQSEQTQGASGASFAK